MKCEWLVGLDDGEAVRASLVKGFGVEVVEGGWCVYVYLSCGFKGECDILSFPGVYGSCEGAEGDVGVVCRAMCDMDVVDVSAVCGGV